MHPSRLSRRAGQMLVFSTLSLIFMFTVVGLSVDLGYSYFKKVQTQAAADAAAQAAALYATANGSVCGSGGVTCGSTYTCLSPPTTPPTTAMMEGCLYAKANGFVNTGSQTVTMIENNTTPPNETGNSPSFWVEATVTETVPSLFLYLAGFHSGSVASEAIAGITVVPSTSCIYILSPNAAQALTVTGGASLYSSGCGVYVNSSSTSAIYETGSAIISASGGGTINVHGTTNICSFSCTASPTPVTGAPTVTDPFATLPAPTIGTSCNSTNYSTPGSGSATISPGVYCGGITVGGTFSLTMNPGTYIMFGGGFNIGNSGIVTGAGVTIYLTGGTMGGTTYTSSGVQLSGSSYTYLTAPTSGTYQGVLFYQDRNVTYTTGNAQGGSAHITNSAGTSWTTGAWYFPTTSLSLSGAVAATKIALIVSTLSVTGSATFVQDSGGSYTGLAKSHSGLFQ